MIVLVQLEKKNETKLAFNSQGLKLSSKAFQTVLHERRGYRANDNL